MIRLLTAAAVAWLGLTASAWAVAISPGDSVSFTGGEIYVADTGLGASAENTVFEHVYTYDMDIAGGGIVRADVDALNTPPNTGPTTYGIANLTFTWEEADTTFMNSLTITDGSGFALLGLPTAFFTFLAQAAGYTLTVTGTTLAGGGDYSLITSVPIPAAAFLFGSALLGGGLLRRRKMIKKFGLPV